MNRELSEEGRQMFDNIDKYFDLLNPEEAVVTVSINDAAPPRTPRVSKAQIELDNFKMEIIKMINNSEIVIKDCDVILNRCATLEDYITSDAKVAKTLHQRLVVRLTRLLSGLPAFEDESHLTLNVQDLQNKIISERLNR